MNFKVRNTHCRFVLFLLVYEIFQVQFLYRIMFMLYFIYVWSDFFCTFSSIFLKFILNPFQFFLYYVVSCIALRNPKISKFYHVIIFFLCIYHIYLSFSKRFSTYYSSTSCASQDIEQFDWKWYFCNVVFCN